VSAVAAVPVPSAGDRLSLALFVAAVVHAVVILGVTFSPPDRPRETPSTLEIILVQHRSESPPEDADYLAQASQDGGGESPEKTRPSTPTPAPFTGVDPELVAASPPVVSPAPLELPERFEPDPAPPPPPAEPAPEPVLTQDVAPAPQQAVAKVEAPPEPVREPEPEPAPAPEPVAERAPEPAPETPPAAAVDAATLVSRSLAMASLSAEIDRKLKAYAERPRRRWITAKTREYRYASYMEAWRAKVERIGNLNYPDEARRRRLSGSLLLDVAINADGSINEILLRRSSGQRVLDDAAKRIVELAAPFAPFPKSIRRETDILHIERTWQFLSSARLTSK